MRKNYGVPERFRRWASSCCMGPRADRTAGQCGSRPCWPRLPHARPPISPASPWRAHQAHGVLVTRAIGHGPLGRCVAELAVFHAGNLIDEAPLKNALAPAHSPHIAGTLPARCSTGSSARSNACRPHLAALAARWRGRTGRSGQIWADGQIWAGLTSEAGRPGARDDGRVVARLQGVGTGRVRQCQGGRPLRASPKRAIGYR